jgi:hypothetical protein
VLEPSVPYPADTEIIANVVSSPHHLGATIAPRAHRWTDLFASFPRIIASLMPATRASRVDVVQAPLSD